MLKLCNFGMSFTSEVIERFGISSMPKTEFITSGFFKKGVERTFWMETTLNREWNADVTKNGGTIKVGKNITAFHIPRD